MGKCLKLGFIETIEVDELNVDTNSWLSEYTNTYLYQSSKSLLDFCLSSLRFMLLNKLPV